MRESIYRLRTAQLVFQRKSKPQALREMKLKYANYATVELARKSERPSLSHNQKQTTDLNFILKNTCSKIVQRPKKPPTQQPDKQTKPTQMNPQSNNKWKHLNVVRL